MHAMLSGVSYYHQLLVSKELVDERQDIAYLHARRETAATTTFLSASPSQTSRTSLYP